jgi:hypothetical protein
MMKKQTGILGLLMFVGLTATAHSADRPCDRSCLNALMDQYLAALSSHDPAALPLASGARYTENTVQLSPGDGFWQTIDRGSIGPSKLYIADPSTNQVAYYGAAKENGHGILFGVRLKHESQRLKEIEAFIVRRSPAIFGTFDTPTLPVPAWEQPLKPEERVSRAEMIHAANQYFEGIEKGDGNIVPLYDDCIRVENGVLTAPRPPENGRAAMSIRESFSSKMFNYIHEISPRRILLVDEERGIVYGTFMFQHPGNIKVAAFEKSYQDPTSVVVYPNTIEIIESFKVRSGKISHIMAQMVLLPYRQPPGWPLK